MASEKGFQTTLRTEALDKQQASLKDGPPKSKLSAPKVYKQACESMGA
jgi:hypothetical protein